MYIEKVNPGNDSQYTIKKEKQEIGTFILSDQGSGVKRLRNLQVNGSVSKTGILYVFELIQAYIQKEEIKEIQVQSHSEELNTLLHHQQFQLEDEDNQLWTYRINC
ncbi:hypothetical protein [Halobacillus seohaensis]|uniref:N-acetyltransferase domain-containing protein n=1 Tax=Halobacillus seohaensis TaxID=447421 RepID=A0ABW2EMW6_9BACI